jgi:hypothetical protein
VHFLMTIIASTHCFFKRSTHVIPSLDTSIEFDLYNWTSQNVRYASFGGNNEINADFVFFIQFQCEFSG